MASLRTPKAKYRYVREVSQYVSLSQNNEHIFDAI